ncbi:competence type IV pilus assembly protein ComGB [Enterococcus nangangensis]|uniref:competence type IV pilus assembly protein ComGB n=1 Tax=Enterococcus nangangensis TaxID=2559926 RepID=UPI002482AC2B|nr:competence type IV pilus assembly protein ComGB [Enterococcus nangangensis]
MVLSLKTRIARSKLRRPLVRSKLCHLMQEMLTNGFALQEVLQFMAKLPHVEGYFALEMLKVLETGGSVPQAFQAVNFPQDALLQLQLAEVHGDLAGTLAVLADTSRMQAQQQKALQKVLAYPLLLLSFVLLILLALKFFLIPQLSASSSLGDPQLLHQVSRLPDYLLLASGGLLLLGLLLKSLLRRWSPLRRANFYARCPLVGSFYQMYVTALFAREFGKLLKLGIDLRQIYRLLATQTFHPLLRALAETGEADAQQGRSLLTSLQKAHFFQPELYTMIQTGEVKGKLGAELLYFSRVLWQRLLEKMENSLRYVQPLIFVGIALLIVLLYAALLLPMYGNQLEGF